MYKEFNFLALVSLKNKLETEPIRNSGEFCHKTCKNSFQVLQLALLLILPFHPKPTCDSGICSTTKELANQLTVKKMSKIFYEKSTFLKNYRPEPLTFWFAVVICHTNGEFLLFLGYFFENLLLESEKTLQSADH